MSEKDPTRYEQQQIKQTCPTCGAEPQQWCVTKNGSRTAFLHGRRPAR